MVVCVHSTISVFSISSYTMPGIVVVRRAVTTEQLGTERQKLTAVLQERQTELHSILQQVVYVHISGM